MFLAQAVVVRHPELVKNALDELFCEFIYYLKKVFLWTPDIKKSPIFMPQRNQRISKSALEPPPGSGSRLVSVFRSALLFFRVFVLLFLARAAWADPAVVTGDPTGGSVLAGGSFSLSVTATGTGPLSYEWRRNGVVVPGGSGASLNLSNVSAAEAGSYTVFVSNSEGNMLSAPAVLLVNEPAVITTQPAGGAILLGGTYTFNVAASGTPPITYEWRKGAAVLAVGTSSSYTVSNAGASDAGSYHAVVSNAFSSGTSSLAADLVVNEPAVITTQPVGGLVSTGTAFTLSVAATGSPPMAYQWRFNSVAIAGATGASYTLSPTALGQSGTYDVVLTNPAGTLASSGTVLTFADPVNITTHPLSYTVAAGTSATFTVAATGSPPLSYQWRKDGIPIGGATLSSYAIASAGTSKAGSYDVVVSNLLGSGTSQSGTLTVFSAPVITIQPAASLGTEGLPVTLSVTATGSGPLNYQWQKRSVPGGPFLQLPGANAPTYTISSPQLADSGTYNVTVSYGPEVAGAAPVVSNPAVLTVAKPVTFVPPLLVDGVVNPDTQHSFFSKASSMVSSDGGASVNSDVSYQWFFNGGTLSGGTVSGGTARLTNPLVQLSDAGTYTVTAKNSAGLTATTSATLTVRIPPLITVQPQSATINVKSVHYLSVAASGTDPLTYQWYNEVQGEPNKAVVGGTGSTLPIYFEAYSTSKSRYTVKVTNDVTTVTSAIAEISLRSPPSVGLQPEPAFATVGGGAKFRVSATGSLSYYNYQWMKDGAPIAGANADILQLSGVQLSDGGSYSCKISTPNGDLTSAVAPLKVFQPVTISSQITGGTVVAGGSFQFDLNAAGGLGDNLTYRWRRNGTPLSSGSYQFVAMPGLTWHQAKAHAEGLGGHLATFTSAAEWAAASAQLGADVYKRAWIGACCPEGADFGTGWTWVTGEPFSPLALWVSGQPVAKLVGSYYQRYLNTTDSGKWQHSENAATGIQGYILEIESSSPSLMLSPVAASDAGNYDVVAFGPGGNITGQSATLTVWTPPVIVTQPAPIQVAVSSTGSMSVSASGTAPLSYQWYKDTAGGGTLVSGGTGATLAFTNASPADSGSYSVVVTNPVSSVTSGKAYVEVYTPVTITSQPVSQTVNPNTPVTFSVVASGTDPLTYAWHDLKGNIPSTDSSFTIPQAKASHAGVYYVVVSNRDNLGVSATSQMFELKVNTVPAVTLQPFNKVVVKGAPATFKAAASGTEPLTYQWKKLVSPGTYEAIAGANSDVYTIANCQPANEGAYMVEVNNITGTPALSSAATLTVLDPVVITSQPASVTVGTGSILKLSVGVTGTEPISYQWYKNNVLIPGETASILFRPLAVPGDAGTYKVVVKNEATTGLQSSNAVVTVLDSLDITSQPASGRVGIGGSYTFSVSASGAGPISYQWRKAAQNISGATGPSHTISPAGVSDSASYDVVVWNSVSSATSTPATLSVLEPVAIDVQPSPQTAPFGGDATFTVHASGSDPRTYQWRRNGVDLPGATASTFVISPVAMVSAGSYDVVVSNPVNSVTSIQAPLSVLSPVSIVTQPAGASVVAGDSFSTSVLAAGSPPITYAWKKAGVTLPGQTGPTLTLPFVQLADAGEYEVEVSNGVNTVASQRATLVVIQPVQITSQPASVTAALGGTASLAVAATGSAPIAYQWRKGGVNLAGQTAATLTFDSVQASDAASYDVVVSNLAGGLLSASATMTVATPPVIVTQPVGGSVVFGGGLTLSVSASGTAPLSYQWRKGGVDVSGGTSSSYAIVNAQPADAGLYTVVVKNAAGAATSVQAAVAMPDPPVITTQPQPAAVPLGGNAFFFVNATGEAPLTYQWKKGGVDIAGAIASSYSIVGVRNADAGTYSVAVSNPGGTVNSNGALLEIVTPPVVTVQPAGGLVAAGGVKVFSVTASGTAPLAYQWRRNGVTISGATAATYSIPSAQAADAGSYDVLVSNAAGSATSEPAPLEVKQGVAITLQPASVGVVLGDAVGFRVTATGDGPLSYQWQKDGVNMAGATGDAISIPVVRAADAASYRVVVSNPVSAVTSSQAVLDILGEPLIVTHPVGGAVPKGSPVTMNVTATGAAPLSYQWYRDGTVISGATTPSYSIASAQLSDDGLYTVRVSNSAGKTVSNPANVVVTEKPVITADPVTPIVPNSPANSPVKTNSTFELSVTATGKEPLTYQWYKNGTLVPGETAKTFQTVTAQEADSGSYHVVVSNEWGTATSQAAAVVVATPVKITQNPGGGLVSDGGSHTFTVAATGTAPLAYQWLKNGTAIPGATGSSYQITGAQAADVGNYSVRVTNIVGTVASGTARLEVGSGGGGGGPVVVVSPATITTQPEFPMLLKAGLPMSLSVTASGTPTLNYQWFAQEGSVSVGTYAGAAIAGGNMATYTKSSAEESDFVDYYVVVSNDYGSDRSEKVRVKVILPVTITKQPADQLSRVDGTTRLEVEATGGSSPVKYQWRKDGVNIAGATASVYFVPFTKKADAGLYDVVVSNAVDSKVSSSATLSVDTAVAISPQPESTTAILGGSASFTVGATGDGPISYQWYKDLVPIPGGTGATLTIASAGTSSAGTYSVSVSNLVSSLASQPASLTVYTPVSITAQPQDTPVNEGANATLSVLATGSSVITYQWSKDGVDIPGATAASYVISVAKPVDAGSYRVLVANPAGSVSSSSAVLTVSPRPRIITHPASTSVVLGGSSSMSVLASGDAPLTYQWRRVGGGAVSGATGATFTVAAAAGSDAGQYEVVVSNGAGSTTSQGAALTVFTPLTITTQPVSQGWVSGLGGSLSVAVSGSEPVSYQWQKDGADVPGATGSSYAVVSAGAVHAGSYRVVATNPAGSVTSAEALVSLKSPVVLLTQPASQGVAPGASASFSVVATGSEAITYQWYKEGDPNPIAGATASAYNIAAVSGAHEGRYYVVATNPVGPVTSQSAKLTVFQAPSIVVQPVDLSVNEGSTATLSVSATGTGPLNYKWRHGGVYVPGASADMLVITNAQASDAGLYFAEVSNVLGTVSSDTVKLTVDSPLNIVTQPVSVAAAAGSGASFSVSATGTSPITYAWSRNGTPVAGGTGSILSIGSVSASDAGNYSVKLTNPAGQLVSSTAVLTLLPAIQITTQPLGGPVNEGGNYTLSVEATGAEPLTYQWYKGNNPIPNATGKTYVLFGAAAGDGADYKVEVSNPAGSVTSSPATVAVQSSVVITKQPVGGVAPTGTPFIFTVENTGSAPLTYKWFKDGSLLSTGSSASYSVGDGNPRILTDSGTYNVVVSNPLNTVASNSVPLTVVDPVVITLQPASNSVKVGSRVSLKVAVTGTPPLMYQWRKNGVPIEDLAARQGVTAATLVFTSFAAGDRGNYDVLITNLAGTVQSQVASMFVMEPPVITGPVEPALLPPTLGGPMGGTVLEGLSFTFNVVVKETGGQPMFYQWKKNTVALGTIAFSSNISLAAGASGSPGTLDGAGAAARFKTPAGVAYSNGELYIADPSDHTVRKMTLAGDVSTFAGTAGMAGSSDGPAGSAQFNAPANLAADQDGNIFVADTENHAIRKIAGGQVTTFAGSLGQSGAANGVGGKAKFYKPAGIATDVFGNVYVSDENHVVRKISRDGDVTAFAGVSGTPGSSDGAGASATFRSPAGLVVDDFGNVFVADSGNHLIRKITSAGIVSTVAGVSGAAGSADGAKGVARFNAPGRLTMDRAGNLFVSDTGNHTIRRITIGGGETSTVAGSAGSAGYAEGAGTLARFKSPLGIANTSGSTFYIGDSGNSVVRKLVYDGSLTGVADAYTVVNAAAADEGDYTVTVTNWAGSVTSGTAALKVFQEVKITSPPAGGGVVLGGSHTFSVTAAGSDIAYQWSKGGVPIAGGTSSSYSIPGVSQSDYGEYSVEVSNAVSPSKSASATIFRVEVPTITVQPEGGIAGLGEPFALEVKAEGTAPLTYEWRRSGFLVQSGTSPSRVLSPARMADAGDYVVTVRNAYGSAVSSPARVSVVDFSLPLFVAVPDGNGVVYSGTQGYRGGVIIERDGPGLVDFTVPMNVPKQIVYEASVASPFTINQSIGPSTTAVIQRSDTSALTLSSGTLTVNPSGTSLISEAAAPFTISDEITGAGSLSTLANGIGPIHLAGEIHPSGDFVNKGTGTGVVTVSGSIGYPARSVVQNSWSSELHLDGSNSYGSPTSVKAGSLVVNADGALGTADAGTGLESGTVLDLRNVKYTVPEELTVNSGTVLVSSGTSTFAGPVVLGSGPAIFEIEGRSLTLDGDMAGEGILKKTGPGDLILKGASTLTGGIRVISGSLFGEGPGCFGSGSVSVSYDGTLVLGGEQPSYVTNAISGLGTLIKTGTNTVTLTGQSLFSGSVSVSSGSLVFFGEATLGDVPINVSEGAWVVFEPSADREEINLNDKIFGPVMSRNMEVKVTWGGGPGRPGGGALGGRYATLLKDTLYGDVGSPLERWLDASPSVSKYELDWIPEGLSLDPKTGIISGTPTVPCKRTAALKLTNPRGVNVVSLNFIISIPPPGAGAPKIVESPVDTVVVNGGTGSVSAYVQCDTSFSYRWQSVNRTTGALVLDPVYTSPAGGFPLSRLFKPAAFADAGDYKLLAWNSAGMVESNAASLTVDSAIPQFETASLLRAGRNFDLRLAKPGIPISLKTVARNEYFDIKVTLPSKAKFKWLYSSSRDSSWKVLGNQVTTLLDFSDKDIPKAYSGYLRLVISLDGVTLWNMIFRIDSYSEELVGFASARPDLKITTNPRDLTLKAGAEASFSVYATGLPVHYAWYKEGVALPLSEGPYPYLVLSNLKESDQGQYYVVVTDLRTTQHTQESFRAVLTVLPQD